VYLLCRKAERARHPHHLRHTYASILLSQNESIMCVKKQLGHHSSTMTVDTYGHWIPGERKVELDRLLSGKTHSALHQPLAHVAQNAKPHAD